MSADWTGTSSRQNLDDLLVEAPIGRHIAQLHKDRQTLTESVCEFAAAGLRRTDSVIMIAAAFHTERYLHRLREEGLDPRELQESGQLVVRDSQELLGRFMRHGMPRWDAFQETLVPIIGSVQASGRRGTRVYGELVSDLWRARNTAASVQVETYWNVLARTHRFCLLCCYELGDANAMSYAHAFDEVGRTHSDLLPATC